MSAHRIAYDIDALALAMLPLLKAQSRIDRDDEDAQAQEIMARAIGRVERQCGIAIAAAEWAWTPRTAGMLMPWSGMTKWRLSEIPVRGIASVTGADAGGVAFSNFTLHGNTMQGAFAPVYVTREGGIQVGDVFTVLAGWDDPADMPPELRDTLVRYAATLWEQREAWQNSSVTSDVPEWVTEALGIFWVPVV